MSIWELLIIVVLVPLALLPTIIAIKKGHPHKIPIILTNIIGGFLGGIGWIVALIWCFIEPSKLTKPSANAEDEIEKQN